MKHLFFALICFFLCMSESSFATKGARVSRRIIPVVAYTPVNFLANVKSSFHVNNQSVYLEYDRVDNKGQKLSLVSPSSINRLMSAVDNEAEHCVTIDSIQKERVAELLQFSDSVFLFLPMGDYSSLSARDVKPSLSVFRYWGIVKGDSLAFYDSKDGYWLRGMRELVKKEYGSYTRFVDSYTITLQNSLLNESAYNAYYKFTESEAKAILKSDYDMYGLYYGKERKQEIQKKFIDFIGTYLILTEDKMGKLDCLPWVADDGTIDVYSFNQAFSTKEADFIGSFVAEHRALVHACLDFLVYEVGPFVNTEGHHMKYKEKCEWVLRNVFE